MLVTQLVERADRATQVSNLLFAAVHDLLLAGTDHSLRDFYASLVPSPRPPTDAYPIFRAFCLEHADTISELVATRRVQTNEVGRCTALLPAFALVARLAENQPLALVEIGASAGLNLHWDRYGYTYVPVGRAGVVEAEVQLTCAVEPASAPLSLPSALPAVAGRIGIDLHPIDPGDPVATRWLRALIWPEQIDRARLLESALAVARARPTCVLAGDAAEQLPDAVAQLPDDAALCVYHSYTLNQCPPPTRDAILGAVDAMAQHRPIWRISLEWFAGQPRPQLTLSTHTHGEMHTRHLAECESHGRSIAWHDIGV